MTYGIPHEHHSPLLTRAANIDHMTSSAGHDISPTHFNNKTDAEVAVVHGELHVRMAPAERRAGDDRRAWDHPEYYGGEDNPHEAIKCMAAHGLLENAPLFTVVKYILRAGKKDPAKTVEDLKKARWYLDYEIQRQDTLGSLRAHDIGG